MKKEFYVQDESLRGERNIRKELFRVNFLKTVVVLLITLFIAIAANAQVAVSPNLFGQNAWMPDTVGNYYSCPDPPCYVNGKLHNNWGQIENSNAVIVRYGGTNGDKNMPTNYQYLRIIDSIRANGMEPIIQVAFHDYRYSSTQAANLVTYLNVTKGRNIKYWTIGNETNLAFSYNSGSIASYYRSYASAMKAADPSIKIIGPEIAWFDQAIITNLTNPGGADDITGVDANGRYYVDIISFHYYPFDSAQTRSDIITKISGSSQLNANLVYLSGRIAAANTAHSRSGSNALKMAITEANVAWRNKSNDGVYGVGTHSFIGGQFWTEILCAGMANGVEIINFWSVIEGSSNMYDLSYLDRTTAVPKPSYYHFKLTAEHFEGATYYPTVAETGNPNQNLKAFVCKKGSDVKILVLNENTNSTTSDASVSSVSVSMTTSAPTGSGTYKFHLAASIPGISFTEKTLTSLVNEATYVNTYNSSGTLIQDCYYKLYGSNALSYTCNTSCTTPAVTATSNSPVCQSATIQLYANTISGASYSWTGPDGWTNSSEDPTRTGAAVTMAGTYTVVATSPGCTSSNSTVYMDVPNFASIGTGGPTTFCSGGSVTLYAATGTGYAWQWIKDGVNISGATANNYVASTSGSYQVKITKNGGTCAAWSAPTTVTVSNTHVAKITPANETDVCQPQTVLLYANTCSPAYSYQWLKKDVNGVYQNISGATSYSYTVTQSGRYQVRVTSGATNLWSSGQDVNIYACRLAGEEQAEQNFIVDQSQNPEIAVYPNPTDGQFRIAVSPLDVTGVPIHIEVLNTLGQLIQRASTNSVSGTTLEIPLDMPSDQPEGLYIVRVTIGNTVMFSKITLAR